MRLHPTLTPDRILEAAERGMAGLDNPGFCTACGAEAQDVEPDARRYVCETCGAPAVYGAEELALMVA